MDGIPLYKISDFSVKEQIAIAEGSFGRVWDAWHARKERVAIKVLICSGGNSFENEVKNMYKASKDGCCVPMFGCINELAPNGLAIKGIVSEYMPCGTLSNLIQNDPAQPPIFVPKCLAYRILEEISIAMRNLHTFNADQRLLHFDLKPSNVMLNQDLHAKITDFGAATFRTVSILHTADNHENQGQYTKKYSAPEYFRGEPRTCKYDVYSFAIIMWEILTGKCAYDGWSDDDIRISVLSGIRLPLDDFTADLHGHDNRLKLIDLITKSWHDSRDARPEFTEVRHVLGTLDPATERQMDEAVKSVKGQLLTRMRLQSFKAKSDDYRLDFAAALCLGNAEGDAPAPANNHPVANPNAVANPLQIQARPEGDQSSSNVLPDLRESLPLHDRYLNDDDFVKLGKQLHHTDGWEMLAFRLGLSQPEVENIKDDHSRAVRRKYEIVRVWAMKNGGSNAKVSDLIRALRAVPVAVNCWDFLDPNRVIRQHLP